MTRLATIPWEPHSESADAYVKWDAIPKTEPEDGSKDSGSHPALTKVMRVDRRPDVMGGRHVIAGTRVPVFWVFDMFLTTTSVEAVRQQYPQLATDDILAAVTFALLNPTSVDLDREEHWRAIDPTDES